MIGRHLLGALAMASLAVLLGATPVRAEGEVGTQIVIHPAEPVVIGSTAHAVLELTGADGSPIADEPVALAMDGEPIRRALTGADGTVSIRLPADLEAGSHELAATYAGRRDRFHGSIGSAVLDVRPFELEVETVPPLPGMVFSLDGQRFVADGEGIARVPVGRAGEYRLVVHADEHKAADRRVEFSRWNTELFGPEILITIPYSRALQSGFDVYRSASQEFVDVDGGSVEMERVTSVTLRSSVGVVYENPDGAERWYKSSRTVRRPNGLESVEIRYNVDSVIVDGANVVNAGQQRFYLGDDEPWTVELLLFSARVRTSDALFGFPAGELVEVTYPDGHVERIEPNADGELEVTGLARGEYRMKVADPPGWAPVVPVALSRHQEVVLRVVTYIDAVTVILVASGLAFGLLHIGRPHLIPGTVGGIGRGIRTAALLPVQLTSPVGPLRRARLRQHRGVPEPAMDDAGPAAHITLRQVVVATIAGPPRAYSFERPGTVALTPEPTQAEPMRPQPLPAPHKVEHRASLSSDRSSSPTQSSAADSAPADIDPRAAKHRHREAVPKGTTSRSKVGGAGAARKAPNRREPAVKGSKGARRKAEPPNAVHSAPPSSSAPRPDGSVGRAGRGRRRTTTGDKPSRGEQRQSQLEVLGIADPGKGPGRDGELPPAGSPPSIQPHRGVRAAIATPEGRRPCGGCGRPLLVAATFCRRCGWRQPATTGRAAR